VNGNPVSGVDPSGTNGEKVLEEDKEKGKRSTQCYKNEKTNEPILFTGTINWNIIPSDKMFEGIELGMNLAADALTKIRDLLIVKDEKKVQELLSKYFGIDSSESGKQNKEYVKAIVSEIEYLLSRNWTIEKEEIPEMEDALLRVETLRKKNTLYINPKWGEKVFTSPIFQTRFQLLHELTHKASSNVKYNDKRHPIVDYYSKQNNENVVPSVSDVQQWAKDDPNKALSSVWNYHYFFLEVLNITRDGL